MIKNTQLFNGIRCVSQHVANTRLVHCGFVLDIGSLDENDKQLGIAHFWEHMAFKGTKNRDAKQIIYSLDKYGGELNAFTSKEKICFYASILEDYTEEAISILVDITFNSIFPKEELEIERRIILEEMSMYLNSPEDAILDHFDSLVFDNHRLGTNILGTESTVSKINQEDFKLFIKENMDTSKVVFSIVSALPNEKVMALVNNHIKKIPKIKSKKNYRPPFDGSLFEPKKRVFYNSKSQSQIVIGCPCYNKNDTKRIPFYLLNNALGGPSLMSILNYNIRETKGLVYSIESVFHSYESAGLFYITFGTAREKVEKTILETYSSIKYLMNSINNDFMIQTKQQLKGQLAIADENNLSKMIGQGKSVLDRNHVKTLSDIFKEIDKVTLTDLEEVAQEIFSKTFSILIYHPTNLIL